MPQKKPPTDLSLPVDAARDPANALPALHPLPSAGGCFEVREGSVVQVRKPTRSVDHNPVEGSVQ